MTDASTTTTTEAPQDPAPTPAEAMPPQRSEPKPDGAPDERVFKQEELERIIADRLSREREKYADYDELRTRSEELKKIEDQNKSEVERLAEEAAAAKWEAENERTQNWKFRAAVKHSIPEDYLDLLGGTTEDEIAQSAERIGKLVSDSRELEALREQTKAPHSTGRPHDNLRSGASPDALPVEDDSYPSSWLPVNHRVQR